ncbi:MAG: signal peptidase I [bacterium]
MTARAYLHTLGLALLAAALLRGFAVQAFKIPSASMMPTLLIGDHLLIDPLSYGLRLPWGGWLLRWATPQPGDVIVFASPRDATQDFVKRVVAVAGERVEVRDKQVLVDGAPRDVDAAYFIEGRSHVQSSDVRANFGPVWVPPGQIFVLGDNRDQSIDSRFWGFVDVSDVRGKAATVYWSRDGDDGWVRWERVGNCVR